MPVRESVLRKSFTRTIISISGVFKTLPNEYDGTAIHRKTPLLESLFDRDANLRACNFIKKRLQHRCYRCLTRS